MSLAHQNLIFVSRKSNSFHPTNPQFQKSPNLWIHPHCHLINLASSNQSKLSSLKVQKWNLRAIGYEGLRGGEGEDMRFDGFLSILETLSFGSSAVAMAGFAASYAVLGPQKAVGMWVGSNFVAWQVVVLVGGIVIGAWIRRRQWRRVCMEEERVRSGGGGLGLLARVEKLEEDVRSSVTILRVLSRQVEKLGIRFRVSRKSLKEPIAETAALAQKNSEATRALAVQEGILEKELGEVQKVLLAMQEQQQKQLELILAIAKSGKLLDNKPKQDTQVMKKPKAEPCYAMDIQNETQ